MEYAPAPRPAASQLDSIEKKLNSIDDRLNKLEGTPKPRPMPTGAAPVAARKATIIVSLPADARLFVDDRATREAAAATRSFTTPDLEPGQDYYYELRAEVVRDGKTVAESQQVVLRAGSEVRVAFPGLPAVVTVGAGASR